MSNNIISTGKRTIKAESYSVAALIDSINIDFEKADVFALGIMIV